MTNKEMVRIHGFVLELHTHADERPHIDDMESRLMHKKAATRDASAQQLSSIIKGEQHL